MPLVGRHGACGHGRKGITIAPCLFVLDLLRRHFNLPERAIGVPSVVARFQQFLFQVRIIRYRTSHILIEPAELEGWNQCQVGNTASRLYASADTDFDIARALLVEIRNFAASRHA